MDGTAEPAEDRLYGLMEVAELQASRDEWARTGAAAKLTRCNPGNRPCVRVDERAGAFESGGHNDYRVIQGY